MRCRYVALRVEAVDDHLLLQLAAYVALLVASKMTETIPLRMKSLANLTGRMFTPRQVLSCTACTCTNAVQHYCIIISRPNTGKSNTVVSFFPINIVLIL